MAKLIVCQLLVGQRKEIRLVNLHLVLRKGTRLIRTDNGSSSHRLASVHLTNQVLGLQHSTHTVSQTQRNGHRQSLWHSHHNKSYGNHQRTERVGQQVGSLRTDITINSQYRTDEDGKESGNDNDTSGSAVIVKLLDKQIEENCHGKDQREGNRIPLEENQQLTDNDESCEDVAHVGNQTAQAIQLLIKRCLDTIVDLSSLEDLTVFCLVTHSEHFHDSVAFHDFRSPHDMVGSEGCILVKILFDRCFRTDRLTGQR